MRKGGNKNGLVRQFNMSAKNLSRSCRSDDDSIFYRSIRKNKRLANVDDSFWDGHCWMDRSGRRINAAGKSSCCCRNLACDNVRFEKAWSDMMKNIGVIFRLALSTALCYKVYQESGVWTTSAIVLITITMELMIMIIKSMMRTMGRMTELAKLQSQRLDNMQNILKAMK